jgi:hypothetical protein
MTRGTSQPFFCGRRKSMNEIQQVMILMPPALAAACAKVAKEKMTSRSCWVRQLIVAALKQEAQRDAA